MAWNELAGGPKPASHFKTKGNMERKKESIAEQIVFNMRKRPFIQWLEKIPDNDDSLGCYNNRDDFIQMTYPHTFDKPAQFWRVLFHELAHSTQHPGRLNRKPTRFTPWHYAIEEVVAELASITLIREVGLADAEVEEESMDYINGYLNEFPEFMQPEVVGLAAKLAHLAAEYILGRKPLSKVTIDRKENVSESNHGGRE